MVAAWGHRHPDHFGGLWFDNDAAEAGVGPVLLAVAIRDRASEDIVASLRSGLQHPDRLAVLPCAFSLRELDAVRCGIREKHMPARRQVRGTYVSTLGLDVRRNRIEVGLSERDEDLARNIAGAFAGFPVVFLYGVRIEPVADRS